MPHIRVQLFPGRDEETKKKMADKLRDSAQEAIGCPKEAICVSVEEVKPEDWNDTVALKVPENEILSGEMWVQK